jgi:hypothetical protein
MLIWLPTAAAVVDVDVTRIYESSSRDNNVACWKMAYSAMQNLNVTCIHWHITTAHKATRHFTCPIKQQFMMNLICWWMVTFLLYCYLWYSCKCTWWMIPYVGGSFDEAPHHYMKLMSSNRSTEGNHYCFHNGMHSSGYLFFHIYCKIQLQ